MVTGVVPAPPIKLMLPVLPTAAWRGSWKVKLLDPADSSVRDAPLMGAPSSPSGRNWPRPADACSKIEQNRRSDGAGDAHDGAVGVAVVER